MNERYEEIASAMPADLDCISAAPAALDHYLAALPAMSLIPFAPFVATAWGKLEVRIKI
jgi:hypothetical protein